MPDYGHDLTFGTFATPSARHAAQVVALAQAAEAAGLDAVTYQDHPYNPDFLDTQTLLAWVAAKTTRIRVAGNVTNLPLRPPVVLAKAAASLDLLSGGRFELGLGAGGLGEAIRSVGGPDLSAGERVDALEQALAIIRGVWSDEAAPLRSKGTHYDVPGMRRGPRPAHDIKIWLGAYKPRMLELTGRSADGWLPTYEYIQSPDTIEANRLIDEAALEAGRRPGDVRRLLNIMNVGLSPASRGFLQGPKSQWIEQLAQYALEYGFSAFFIGGDDPELIRTLGEEIAPAVRAAVAKEREPAPAAPARPISALSKRPKGVDRDALPAALRDGAVGPGDPDYAGLRHSHLWPGAPALILRPRTAEEASQAVGFARRQGLAIAVRSGGHGVSGRSTNSGGVVIDLGRMNKVQVLDRERRLIRLEPGAIWGDVAATLGEHGLAMSSGDYGDVGVGGLATAGGVGYLGRRYGLTIDHIVAAEIVLADGRIVRTDAGHQPELLWAIRGAGANFGIVTAFELEAYELGDVVQAVQIFDASDTAAFVERWGRLVEAAPREVTSFLSMFPGQFDHGPMAQAITLYAGDDVAAAEAALSPLAGAGRLLDQRAHLLPYAAVVRPIGGAHQGGGLSAVRSGLVEHLTAPVAERVAALIDPGGAQVVQIRSMGGAINDQPADAMAYSHRTQNFSITAATVPTNGKTLDRAWADLHALSKGMYLNFETGTHPGRLLDAFPEPVFTRLRELKARYDPDNVFNTNFGIPPAQDLKAAS